MRSWIPTVVSLSKNWWKNILLLRWSPLQWSLDQQLRSLWTSEVFMFIQKEPVLIRSLNWNSQNAIQKLASLVVQRSCNLTEWFHACCFFIGYIYLGLPQGTRSRISQWVVGRRLVGQTGLIFNPQGDHEAMKDMLPYRTCNKWLQIGMYPCTHATNCWMLPYRTC